MSRGLDIFRSVQVWSEDSIDLFITRNASFMHAKKLTMRCRSLNVCSPSKLVPINMKFTNDSICKCSSLVKIFASEKMPPKVDKFYTVQIYSFSSNANIFASQTCPDSVFCNFILIKFVLDWH